MPDDLLTTTQAAAELGLSTRRVRELIAAGHLPVAQRAGTYALIRRADLEMVRVRRPPGWPKRAPAA